MNRKPNIAFFGTPDRAVWVLDILASAGLTPRLIITRPDRPQGRRLVLTAPPAKVWAQAHDIPVLQPEKLDEDFAAEISDYELDLSIVVAYGKIIPHAVLDIPKHGTLNIHGSLLPKYRGSCPIETAIVSDDKETGVSIILMDAIMDHGPVIASERVSVDAWPPSADELAKAIVEAGARLLVTLLPKWLEGNITPREQDHSQATFTQKIKKEDGQIDLNDDPYKNFLKIKAYEGWPKAFFFEDGKRFVITKARFENGTLFVEKVIPEGGKEINYRR